MHRSKRKRNLIIFSLVGVLLCMAIGYAAFQTQLKVTGTTKVTSNWDIEITNVTSGTPTGSAENAVAPSFDKLWASMEANLYDKGDAMEYDVTIENKGTLDAKLNDIITNLDNSNNEAVIISFSGYTKGEILKAKNTKVVHVKIEYNPEYEGGETSSEVEINFDYGQNNNEENNPDNQYLLTYDCVTNGGNDCSNNNEYLISGSSVDLTKTGTKEGWNFVGWNTDKDAEVGLESYQMPASNTTLYAIYSKTLKTTYEKGDNIKNIGKNEDTCNIYNNETSCEIILPEITATDESAKVGWYDGNNKVGNPNDKYTITNDITLRAEAEFEPIIQRWMTEATTDFHAEEYRINIITARFLDNKDVPEGAISWDVSEAKDGSVMAWVIPDETDSTKYHLYIGGDGGVIANQYSSYLFRNFTNLQQITFGDNFDTSNTINTNYMFAGCNNLISVDVNNFDTSQVTNMNSMFYNCSQLTALDVSNFNTSKVTNMMYMFYGCSHLTTLDVSNFNTSKATSMNYMFYNCSSLTKLVLCNWDTSKVTGMNSMFYNTSSLKSIYVGPNWTTENATTTSMFNGSGVSSVTQSNNCEIDSEDMSLSISTTSTTNSITVVANATADSGIAKYEYSKDGGKTWETSANNTYTFTGLTTATAYDIKVRVTSNIGKTLEKGIGVDITNNVVTTGDGLYEDEYENGRYVYKGKSPNNYISFNNELWRILSVESDGSLKIIRNNYIGDMTFDTTGGTHGNNNWDRPADIKTYLNNDYFSTITTNKEQVASHTWSIGKVENANTDLAGQINDENSVKSEKANIGLITASEYLRANTNKTQCGNLSLNNTNRSICKNTNWIYSLISSSNFLWTISPSTSSDDSVVSIYALITYAGYINNNYASNSYGVLPAIYLTQQTKIIGGEGSQTNPYLIDNGISTSTLEKPTFKETKTDNGKTVTINYPSGCGRTLTCTYQKDNGSVVNVKNSTVDVEFTADGSLVANVSDETNSVSSSYTVEIIATAVDTITELVSTNPDELYTDENGNIRYYGSKPNNYVSFNNELWRIIGVIDGKIKIIRNESIGDIAWDSDENNNWDTSSLKSYLNKNYYNIIESTSKEMISTETYYLGGPNDDNFEILTANGYYNAERSSNVPTGHPTSTTQNIGLLYPSDYGYASGEKCLSTALYNFSNNTNGCPYNNYLYNSDNEILDIVYWLQTPLTSNHYNATLLELNGTVNGTVVYSAYEVRPVTYLKTTVKIIGGNGTESNPFKLEN